MKKIPLTQGLFALVDNEDFEELNKYKWHTRKSRQKFYAVRMSSTINGERNTIYMSRQIMDCPDDLQVDHVDTDTLDNQKHNLRICTETENCINHRSQRNSSSQFRGVCWRKDVRKWQATINVTDFLGERSQFHLGYFCNEKEAAKAYDNMARKEHGDFARLNFPLEGEQSALCEN